jgi:hypothetical protein
MMVEKPIGAEGDALQFRSRLDLTTESAYVVLRTSAARTKNLVFVFREAPAGR